MTPRGEGLARAPRVYSLAERGQLLRRARYAAFEYPLLRDKPNVCLALLAIVNEDVEDEFVNQDRLRRLARTLHLLGVPERLPRNAAAPRPRRG